MRSSSPIKGELLAGVELFADLDLAARQKVAQHCARFNFAPGDVVLNHLDTSREVFFVLNGTVEVSLISVNGRRTIFNQKAAGQMVGELAAIDGQPRSAQVMAKTECHAISIAPDDFLHIVASHPGVAHKLLQRLASQVRVLSERVFEFNALCVDNRIHVELLRQARTAQAKGNQRLISPAPTHADIASCVSTHREAVSRELSRLTKEGLLEKQKDTLIVTDIKRLEEMVERHLGEVPAVC